MPIDRAEPLRGAGRQLSRRTVRAAASLPPEIRRLAIALAPVLLVLAVGALTGPLAQPEAYHHFKDGRPLVGVPNALNVLSNLPFAVVGIWGLAWLACGEAAAAMPRHLRRCYGVMFAGVALTAVGSTYYHCAPDNGTLVWDRLPMAIAFMGLFAGFLSERLGLGEIASGWLLCGLLAFGVGSVAYWFAVDDLRLYAIAQFYPVVAIPLILWLTRAPYTRGADWMVALGAYFVAKALEEGDGVVFAAFGYVSGHTLKHLAAAAGAWWIYRMLRRRRPLDGLSA